MCRPEPVSPDSPYADPGPKRLTAALSPSGCQPSTAGPPRGRPPSLAVTRDGRPKPTKTGYGGLRRPATGTLLHGPDLRISLDFRSTGQGATRGGPACGRRPSRVRGNRGSRAGATGDGSGGAPSGRRARGPASGRTADPDLTRSGHVADDGRNQPLGFGRSGSRGAVGEAPVIAHGGLGRAAGAKKGRRARFCRGRRGRECRRASRGGPEAPARAPSGRAVRLPSGRAAKAVTRGCVVSAHLLFHRPGDVHRPGGWPPTRWWPSAR